MLEMKDRKQRYEAFLSKHPWLWTADEEEESLLVFEELMEQKEILERESLMC